MNTTSRPATPDQIRLLIGLSSLSPVIPRMGSSRIFMVMSFVVARPMLARRMLMM